jgi:prohibitin 2
MNRARDFVNSAARAANSAGGGRGGGGGGGGGMPPGAILGLVGLVAGGYGLYASVKNVEPGHLGITYSRYGGLNDKATCKVGLNLVVPWFQRLVIFDIRTRPHITNSISGSKDLQQVQISIRVLFRPDPNHISNIYRNLGKDFEDRVLPSIVNEVSKAVVAQYNASELLTKREAVSKQINFLLTKRAMDFNILLDDVSITHLAFSKEYTAAVEAKQVAQQDSERAKYVVEKALQEKRSIVIKAEGEAQSAMLIGNVIFYMKRILFL